VPIVVVGDTDETVETANVKKIERMEREVYNHVAVRAVAVPGV
jgi:hypothetical protein